MNDDEKSYGTFISNNENDNINLYDDNSELYNENKFVNHYENEEVEDEDEDDNKSNQKEDENNSIIIEKHDKITNDNDNSNNSIFDNNDPENKKKDVNDQEKDFNEKSLENKSKIMENELNEDINIKENKEFSSVIDKNENAFINNNNNNLTNENENENLLNQKDNNNKRVSFKSNPSIIQTETDIKEEILLESLSSKEKEQLSSIKKENNKIDNNINNNINNNIDSFLPQSILSQTKIKNIQFKKEKLNNSFKLSKKNNIVTSLNELNSLSNKSRSLSKFIETNYSNKYSKSNFSLPRISSASNFRKNCPKLFLMKPNEIDIKNHINKKSKINNGNIPYNNKTLFIPQKKNKLNKPTQNKASQEFLDLEKENNHLIKELQNLNYQLNILINQKIPRFKQNILQKEQDKINENIKNGNFEESNLLVQKKYLSYLVNQYNSLFNKLNKDTYQREDLEDLIDKAKIDFKQTKSQNKNLKEKIFKNEIYLKNSEKQQKMMIQNIDDLDSKYDLFRNKLSKMKNEINRKETLLEKEKEKILLLYEKYNKLKEILKYYEETPYSINQKFFQNIKNKEKETQLNSLIKKKNVLKHSRLSMKKSFDVEIEKQKKFIEHLKKTIVGVENVLNTLD